MRRDQDRSKPGEDACDAQDWSVTGGRAGQGVQGIQIRHGRVLGVRGHGVHGHHIPSGRHMQNGPGARPGGRGRPAAEGARNRRSQGGGRVHYADDRAGKHERADHNDRGESVGHDQG